MPVFLSSPGINNLCSSTAGVASPGGKAANYQTMPACFTADKPQPPNQKNPHPISTADSQVKWKLKNLKGVIGFY